jgi:thioredoxin 1
MKIKSLTAIVIAFIVISLGIAVAYYYSNESQDTITNLSNSSDSNFELIAESQRFSGTYQTYSSEKISLAQNSKVVLFFHASWCPTCRGLSKNIEENITLIPKNVNILKVDYDKELTLKQKYGITTQHTLVLVNENGDLIKKWSGGSKLQDLLNQLE